MKFLNFITFFMIRPNPVRKKTKQNKTNKQKKIEINPTPPPSAN